MPQTPARTCIPPPDPVGQTPVQDALPPVMHFQDVMIGPAPGRTRPGALWPEFHSQTHARLFRRGRLSCAPPRFPDGAGETVDEPVIFASVYENHFGHLVAETVPRLPQALAEWPDLPVVFTRLARDDSPAPSAMFRAVMDWLNVPQDRVRLVTRPTLFRQVHVAAQGEHLDGPPTPAAYLDALEARIADNLPRVTPSGVAFVTRAGLEHTQGAHAAERYLVACLRDLGVRIVYPEALNLHEQMQHYAQAAHLVFSEGSAIHGRQLLGRIDQDIAVLRRRKGSNMGRGQIGPRCRDLTYVRSFGGGLHVTNGAGAAVAFAMKSFYHMDALLAYFDTINVPLRQRWDRKAYRQCRDQDVLSWVFAMYDPMIVPWLKPANEDEYLLAQFDDLHLGHLKDKAAALIAARRVG